MWSREVTFSIMKSILVLLHNSGTSLWLRSTRIDCSWVTIGEKKCVAKGRWSRVRKEKWEMLNSGAGNASKISMLLELNAETME